MTNFSGKHLNAACGGPQGGGMDSRRNGVAEISPKYLAEVASNAIRSGYKQTEVGKIPEDWQVTTVGKVVSITTGNKNTQDKVVDGLYPFFVRSQQVERINTYSFDGEGVLTAGDGVGTGKIFHHIDGKFDFHQRVYLMYNFGDELDGYYFYIYFSNNFYDRIMSMTAKSSVDSVRREMIADMLMVLPPKAEQTAIANALSDVDALISELEKLIAKKQAIKTATMQQLLTGRTRLPQFALRDDGTPKGTKPSELGEIPEDWEVVELGKLLAYEQPTNYLISHTKFLDEGLYPVLTAGKSFILGYTNEEHGVFTNLPVIIFDDFTTDSKFVDFPFKAKSSAMKMLKPINKNIPLSLIYNLLNSVDYLVGDHKRHWIGEFQFLNVAIPSKENEQTAIATILSDMDAEIQALEQRLGKTRQIKQGMMQELLTGKTRLIQGSEAR